MNKKITKSKYKKLEQDCLLAIEENNLIFADEIFAFVQIQPSEFFDCKLNESLRIKDAIDVNRAKFKRDMRLRWLETTNATLNAALYRLVCTEEERRLLSSSAGAKNVQNNDICTQEEYLKSLKEMSEGIENAD